MGTNWKCLIAASMTLVLGSACGGDSADETDRHPITDQPNSGESNGSTTGESSGAGPEGVGVAGQGSNTASNTGSSGTDGSGTPGAGTTGQTSNDGATGQAGGTGSTGQSGNNDASGNAPNGETSGMPDDLVLTGVDESKPLGELTEEEITNLCVFLDRSRLDGRSNYGGSSSDEDLYCTYYWGGGPYTTPEECREMKEDCLAEDWRTIDLNEDCNSMVGSFVEIFKLFGVCRATVGEFAACRHATDQAEWNAARVATCDDPNTRAPIEDLPECIAFSSCQF